MARKSAFQETIEFEGATWHLVFDPASTYMVAPNLQGAQITPLRVNKVVFSRTGQPAWIATLCVTYPAGVDSMGRLVNERRMLGFRTFDYEPPKQLSIPYNEFAYYVAEPVSGNDSMAQRFLDAVSGANKQGGVGGDKPQVDVSWTKQFVEDEGVAQEQENGQAV